MKSILIEKPNQLAIVEREIPTPSAGEVRVKVKLAGILITHTFDFQHVADAISLFEQDQKHCCKVLLTFSE